jgi:hypothetical protein
VYRLASFRFLCDPILILPKQSQGDILAVIPRTNSDYL